MPGLGRHRLDELITQHLRGDAATVRNTHTVGEALAAIRARGSSHEIVYFYVLDSDERLVGVLPTRRLLSAPLEQPISAIMDTRIVAIPETFTVLDACEFFVLHRFLAFPVVAADRRLLGVIDVSLYTEEMFDVSERQHVDQLFESLGIRLSQVRNASFGRVFRARFSWLLSTLLSGVVCALFASVFRQTLAESVILAFFFTLVLGVGESVCVQSLSLTVDSLRHERPRREWFMANLRRELAIAFSMGVCAALLAAGFAYLWHGQSGPALALLIGIAGAMTMASAIGFSVPVILHRLKLDLKLASGPVALALTDVATIVCYLSAATAVL